MLYAYLSAFAQLSVGLSSLAVQTSKGQRRFTERQPHQSVYVRAVWNSRGVFVPFQFNATRPIGGVAQKRAVHFVEGLRRGLLVDGSVLSIMGVLVLIWGSAGELSHYGRQLA
jgi:hypothetical protein